MVDGAVHLALFGEVEEFIFVAHVEELALIAIVRKFALKEGWVFYFEHSVALPLLSLKLPHRDDAELFQRILVPFV